MSVAITEEHRALATTVASLLSKHDARASARELLEAPGEALAPWWADAVELGLLGLHLPEADGGSGFGMPELVVVVEQLGRAVAPGPFAPTAVVSAVLSQVERDVVRDYLPDLANGSLIGGLSLGGDVSVADGRVSGDSGAVLGGGLANVVLVPNGDDALLIPVADGVSVEVPPNLDPTRRSARMRLDDAPCTVLPGAGGLLVDIARLVLSAEAVGVARQCTELAAEYAKQRTQFGRPIATFQAVKHHCANMAAATEMATSAVWDAARAAAAGADQFSYAAAVAATLAGPAADLCANLNTQVHGGIAITWEHDAHL